MQSSRRAALRVWAMGLLLVAAVVGGLALHGDAQMEVVDGLGMLAVWMSAGVCWLAVRRVGFRRWEVLLFAAAVTAFAAALTYDAAAVALGGRCRSPRPRTRGTCCSTR